MNGIHYDLICPSLSPHRFSGAAVAGSQDSLSCIVLSILSFQFCTRAFKDMLTFSYSSYQQNFETVSKPATYLQISGLSHDVCRSIICRIARCAVDTSVTDCSLFSPWAPKGNKRWLVVFATFRDIFLAFLLLAGVRRRYTYSCQ